MRCWNSFTRVACAAGAEGMAACCLVPECRIREIPDRAGEQRKHPGQTVGASEDAPQEESSTSAMLCAPQYQIFS